MTVKGIITGVREIGITSILYRNKGTEEYAYIHWKGKRR